MKKMLLAAGIVASAALAACSTAQQDSLNASLSNLNKTNLLALQAIKNGCSIVQPTLSAAGAADPKMAADAASSVVAAQAPAASAPVAASAAK